MIRVILPWHLRNLARVDSEVMVAVSGPITQRTVLDALETMYPVLRGTIRDHDTARRRPFLRFFACEEDLSHESPDSPLPEAVAKREGAVSGRRGAIAAVAQRLHEDSAGRPQTPVISVRVRLERRVRTANYHRNARTP